MGKIVSLHSKLRNDQENNMPVKNEIVNSTIGEGSVFEGKFFIDGSININGKFEGEIKTNDQIVVGESGKVKTNIYAKNAIIAGVVIGNIEAEQEVSLLKTGKVLGNIKAPKLYVEEGVLFQGNVTITAQSKNAIDKTIVDDFGMTAKDLFKDQNKQETIINDGIKSN